MLQRTVTALAAGASVALLASPASAQGTETDQFEVSIHVQPTCVVIADDLSFAIVDDLTQPITATTEVRVHCVGEPPVNVSFNVGDGGGTFQTRTMKHEAAAQTIAYNIYADDQHTVVLGDDTNGTQSISVPADCEIDVHGRTNPNQTPKPAGAYKSTITATLTF